MSLVNSKFSALSDLLNHSIISNPETPFISGKEASKWDTLNTGVLILRGLIILNLNIYQVYCIKFVFLIHIIIAGVINDCFL